MDIGEESGVRRGASLEITLCDITVFATRCSADKPGADKRYGTSDQSVTRCSGHTRPNNIAAYGRLTLLFSLIPVRALCIHPRIWLSEPCIQTIIQTLSLSLFLFLSGRNASLAIKIQKGSRSRATS